MLVNVSLDKHGKNLCCWLLCVVLILSLSFYGRRLQLLLIQRFDMTLIAVVVFVVLFGVLLFFSIHRQVYALSRRVLFGTYFLLFIAGYTVHSQLVAPVETLHFLVFSCFGWFSAALFGVWYGVVAVVSMAVSDEIFQYFLPDRIGDIRDVVINAISGIIGLLFHGK